MLHLKRASAGSGKTYELTKTFIKALLTIREPGFRRRLRSPEALQEALRSIMAVTFTVKATAEMKTRIVVSLAALAASDRITDPEKLKKVPYLADFEEELNVGKLEIAMMAREALRIVLLHYSDFRVQTIDSFFQGVLHTFAYEASLDDNFNMEIDTDYIASVGFDAALDSIANAGRSATTDSETLYWIRTMMDEAKSSNFWNVFARSEGNTLYSELIGEAKNLDKEDFRNRQRLIADYFDNLDRPFRDIVAEVEEANLRPLRLLHDRRRAAARTLIDELTKARLTTADLFESKGGAIKKSIVDFSESVLKEIKPFKMRNSEKSSDFLSGNGSKALEANMKKYRDFNATLRNDIDSAFLEWLDAHNDYVEELETSREALNTWFAYRELLPKLMTVLEIARKKREFLEATNTLEISDTTHILARIIGDDDAPFVYERMGSRLDHYLIDEFQDTSRMQWHNLRPLLAESESRGQDNLIIGDAKQSIYRFRNADYRLITDEVEHTFAGSVVPYTSDAPPADMRKENTNYRSKARIVKFNNHIFSNVINMKAAKGETEAYIFNPRIHAIYADAIQNIPDDMLKEDLGYVEVTVYPQLKTEEKENFDSEGFNSLGEPGLHDLPDLILRLTERGYSFRDIGVLVRTRDQGRAVVRRLTSFNAENPDNKIKIISEENLLVSSALSVRIILHALELAMRGSVPEEKRSLLGEPVDDRELMELLHSLQSQSLPSITEAIADRFVSKARRNSEAPFLAAFQDAVLDYCSSHSSDIGSFLKWWKRKSKSLRINTPEESDGVRIHTIHGSKGLEYKCVIIPKADMKFIPSDSHTEWKWVQPDASVAMYDSLPPFLPVATKSSLAKTAHKKLWERYCEEVALDELNKMYVGFTRAVNELYIYAPIFPSTQASTAEALLRYAEGGEFAQDGTYTYKYGEPLTAEQILAEKKENEKPESIANYSVSSNRQLLRFEDGNALLKQRVKRSQKDDDELDPRSEGTLKHSVLQMIERPEDLDKALLRMKVGGLISQRQMEEWGDELRAALDSVADYGWFADGIRVLNERTLFYLGEEYLRPDRIVVGPEGDAVIIDYKFGKPRKQHKEKISEYASRLLSTGSVRSVKAFLWYVKEGAVVPVG